MHSSFLFFNIMQFILEVFQNSAGKILSSAFYALYRLSGKSSQSRRFIPR